MASLISGKELPDAPTLTRSKTTGGYQLLPGSLLVSSLDP